MIAEITRERHQIIESNGTTEQYLQIITPVRQSAQSYILLQIPDDSGMRIDMILRLGYSDGDVEKITIIIATTGVYPGCL